MVGGTKDREKGCQCQRGANLVWSLVERLALTVDAQVKVLGFFAGCIHDTALVTGLVPKTGTFYPQNLTPVCHFQVGITQKHQP